MDRSLGVEEALLKELLASALAVPPPANDTFAGSANLAGMWENYQANHQSQDQEKRDLVLQILNTLEQQKQSSSVEQQDDSSVEEPQKQEEASSAQEDYEAFLERVAQSRGEEQPQTTAMTKLPPQLPPQLPPGLKVPEEVLLKAVNEQLLGMNEQLRGRVQALDESKKKLALINTRYASSHGEQAAKSKKLAVEVRELKSAMARLERRMKEDVEAERESSEQLREEILALKQENKSMKEDIEAERETSHQLRELNRALKHEKESVKNVVEAKNFEAKRSKQKHSHEMNSLMHENEQLRMHLYNKLGYDTARLVEENHGIIRENDRLRYENKDLRMQMHARVGQERGEIEMLRLSQIAYKTHQETSRGAAKREQAVISSASMDADGRPAKVQKRSFVLPSV